MTHTEETLGATYLGDGSTRFVVWAPHASQVELHLISPDRTVPMQSLPRGYFEAVVSECDPGRRYYYRLGGNQERPDLASRFQPEGVHGPSQVLDRFFDWRDADWFGLALQNYIIYELHVGAFTPEGTFDAIIPHLDELAGLGITAVELMPVNQFHGARNWGYDGVYPFAVQNSYGGPEGLKRLVNACHARGLAVILDVVYNHVGPEGNYFAEYGPYFTDRYKTPWGVAVNFDGPESDEVRRYFRENAEMWAREFHVDALRLDAVDNIFDFAAGSFLEELAFKFDQLEQHLPRKLYLMVESDLNSPRLVSSREQGGYGLDAQWTDDFHHALFTLLTGDYSSYYIDFKPDSGAPLQLLAKAFRDGYVYTGEYSVFRHRTRGVPARALPGYRHVVFAQNHDQVGNRMQGDRLNLLVSFEAYKLAAGLVLLSPFIPLLFMGEEYGETAPFLFFVDYGDPALAGAVQEGRRAYFGGGNWQGEPPDPTAQETFERSQLHHAYKRGGKHQRLCEFYRQLIGLRKTLPALRELSKENQDVSVLSERVLQLRRWYGDDETCALFNFSEEPASVAVSLGAGRWQLRLNSADPCWRDQERATPDEDLPPSTFEPPGQVLIAPQSFVLYEKA